MKAIAVIPGSPNSVHLADLPKPSVDEIPNGRGVLVKVLRVGVDGTDKEINAAEYGAAPAGYDFLVIGHESFGRVEAVGANVTELKPGDYVVATVRRPGESIYDVIGTNDMTTDDVYFERGINLRHGYPDRALRRRRGVHREGTAGAAGGWRAPRAARPSSRRASRRPTRSSAGCACGGPRRAAVMGAGTIGLLATLVLRLRGLEVTTFARNSKPNMNADLVEALGARYVTTKDLPVTEAAGSTAPSTSSSRRPGIRRSCSTACGRSERTACSCSRA